MRSGPLLPCSPLSARWQQRPSAIPATGSSKSTWESRVQRTCYQTPISFRFHDLGCGRGLTRRLRDPLAQGDLRTSAVLSPASLARVLGESASSPRRCSAAPGLLKGPRESGATDAKHCTAASAKPDPPAPATSKAPQAVPRQDEDSDTRRRPFHLSGSPPLGEAHRDA